MRMANITRRLVHIGANSGVVFTTKTQSTQSYDDLFCVLCAFVAPTVPLLRAVLFCALDDGLACLPAKLQPGGDVAAEVDSGPQPRLARLVRLAGEGRCFAWEEVAHHFGDRARKAAMR